MFDERYWCSSVEIVRNQASVGWAADLPRMCTTFCLDGKTIFPAQGIKLSKNAGISTAVVQFEASLTEFMQSLLGKAQVFEEEFRLSSADMCIIEFVDDVMFTKFLAASSFARYRRYIRARKVTIKYKKLLMLLMELGWAASVERAEDTKPLDKSRLYILSENDNLLMIFAADGFARMTISLPFPPNSFHGHAKALFDALPVCLSEEDEELFSMFWLLLETKIDPTKLVSHYVICFFISTMLSLDYNAMDRWESVRQILRSSKGVFHWRSKVVSELWRAFLPSKTSSTRMLRETFRRRKE